MCGIAGYFGHREVPESVGRAILDALRPRGPDAQHSVALSPTSALFSTRLSIRDPRPIADQPMCNDAKDLWLCYNGEVYGWEEDARLLGDFKTRGDTEFILRAYEKWGIDFLSRLRGMFAIALLDLRRRTLLLVRDRMGLKPLVYYHEGEEFAFGSTVRSVLPYVPASRRAFSPLGIDAYLAHRYVPAPRTIFEHIRRLENGHYLSFDLTSGKLSKERHWRPGANSRRGFRETLEESVRLRTVADRPVGIFLSGGVDSTTVASSLARQGFRNIEAYTAAFPGSEMDESAQAARVAERIGLPHHIVPITQDLGRDFERFVADMDEPFADPSAVPLWYLSRETTRSVKVVLCGDGGDELFAGYKRYAKHLRSSWRKRFRLPVGGGLGRWLEELGLPWTEAYALRFSGMAPSLRQRLQPSWRLPQVTYWRDVPGEFDDPLQALLDVDMSNYLPEYILRKGDLCTMAHGLEARAPLLDHCLYEETLALPRERRFTRPPKLFLKEVCPVGAELGLFEQKKRGFNPPLEDWIRRDLAPRLPELGGRLERLTAGQVGAEPVAEFVRDSKSAEQILQLAILDESLRQLSNHG